MNRSRSSPGANGAVRRKTSCRVCAGQTFQRVLDLGRTPLANSFLRPQALDRPEPTFPLQVVRCRSCGLVQLAHVVDRDRMFRDYVYFSSASAPMAEHFARLAAQARRRYAPRGPALAVEIGSNDGTLLRNFLGSPVAVLGVEPARNIARAANAAGVRTWTDYFGLRVARRIRRELGPARLVFSNNVVAHIDDVHEVAAGVAHLLHEDGAWIIEVPHLAEMVRHVEFDTVYHEHLSYFSLPPLERLVEAHGLRVVHVDRVPVHGGSLRVTVRRAATGRRADASLARVRAYERRLGLGRDATYDRFRRRVQAVRARLPALLSRLRARGGRIVGYGAPAKGNTLLNACGIDARLLDYLVDTTPAKQGLFAPGSRLRVRPPEAFHDEPPAYALLLAWNFEHAILAQEADYLRAGGRFIRPVPVPRLLPPRPPREPRRAAPPGRGRGRG